jgi:serine/threonine-protein kinase
MNADPDRTLPPATATPLSVGGETRDYSDPGGETGPEVVPAAAGRFELRGEIGRGGMGAVFRARDPGLNRDLAIKVLLEKFAGRPDVVRRFVEEAQVGGQLQHPGVVPVYELGRFADGRPFFAMKLVKGRTLDDLLAERPGPAHDLPRFLQIFEQVCQAVAYAHSHNVIHRDLKPANVMVGAFGEVQVMDWGLAKVLASRGREPPESPEGTAPTLTEIATARSGEGGLGRRPARRWGRQRSCHRSRPTARSGGPTSGPTCSGWAPSWA